MSGRDVFDREFTAYLEGRSTNSAPDGLLERAMQQIETTGQRPSWSMLERWLPSRMTDDVAEMRRAGVLVVVTVLLVTLAIAVAIVAGSRPRVPPPFGMARPGLIAFDLGDGIYVANPDGSGRRRLIPGSASGWEVWSPDGTRIAYQTRLPDLSTGVTITTVDGARSIAFRDHLVNVGDLSWSPDSRRVAFSARLVGADDFHIYVADADTSEITELGGPSIAGQEPSWSPDGREIAFKWTHGCCGPTAVPDALWLIGADGSHAHQLWTNADQVGSGDNALWNTTWSPDSRRLAFLASGKDGRLDVFVINADGSGARNITNSPEDEYWPSWSPDGTRIAFARMSLVVNNQGSLVVLDPDGSHPVVLDGPPVNSNTPVWSPDGRRLLGYAKNPDPNLDYNEAIAIFDPSGLAPTILVPASNFGGASWQRLAP
jgi:Tol biopolymer transport system component